MSQTLPCRLGETAATTASLLARIERIHRDALAHAFGGSHPALARIAHLHAQAVIARALANALEVELGEADAALGCSQRALLEHDIRDTRAEAHRLETLAARARAEFLAPGDGERLLALEERIAVIVDSSHVGVLVNDLVLIGPRLDERAMNHLRTRLESKARERGLALTTTQYRRLEHVRDAAPAKQVDPGDVRRSVSRLLRDAECLQGNAAGVPAEELLTRIESIAGRLKDLDEHEIATDDGETRRLLKRAFGTLTRISKDHEPGFTPVLDSSRRGEDWLAMAHAADARIKEIEAARAAALREAERADRLSALARLRESDRIDDLEEQIHMLRAALYARDDPSESGAAEADAVRALKRACRLARTNDEVLRIAGVLGSATELAARGRHCRALRRVLGLPEPDDGTPVASIDGAASAAQDDDEDDPAIDDASSEWPESIADTEGAGRDERVLIAGGLRDDRRRQRLTGFFGWRECEWAESYRERQADFATLRKRITAGRFDRVIILARFCGHDVTQGLANTCRARDVPLTIHGRSASIPALAQSVYGA